MNYKRIPMEHLTNCRDLGGYGCSAGKMTRYKKLLRSEAPSQLTEQEWAVFEEMGVRAVIDLRSEREQAQAPYTAPDGIEQISYPLLQGGSSGGDAAASFMRSLEDGYTSMVEDAPQRMTGLLELVAEKLERGAVLYHCTAGKDRTGVLTALIYLICGVDELDIIADYQVSATYQAENPMFGLVPPELRGLLDSKPETMRAFLARAKERDYFALLKENGLTQSAIDAIKNALAGC